MDKYELRWGRVFSRREEERARESPSLGTDGRKGGLAWQRVEKDTPQARTETCGEEGMIAEMDTGAETDALWECSARRKSAGVAVMRGAVGRASSDSTPTKEGRPQKRKKRGRRPARKRQRRTQRTWNRRSKTPTEKMTARNPRLGSEAPSLKRRTLPGAQARQGRKDRGRDGRNHAGRDASRQEEHYAERSRQQERRDWGVHAGAVGTQGERGKREEEGPRASGEGSRRWERPSVNPRALDWRQAQGGWGEDGARSPDRELMHKGGWEGEPRAASHHWRREEGREEGPSSSERRGQRQEGRGGEARTSGPQALWERRVSGGFRSPLVRQQREEKAAETGARPEIVGSKEGEKHGNRRQRGSGSERRARRGGERHESRRHEREGVRGRRGAREKGTVTRAGTGGRAELEGGA
ncbi:unnamed protein product [Closterium sp. NIES-65]|nr:unnamed protein product [Closterium sp. NIES-65]